ncbi:MAG: hypothetical protein J0H68_03965 [Sphingobacteriia bacterium]|nr:hypothetical protein [Sphingobacteriia bacterium]
MSKVKKLFIKHSLNDGVMLLAYPNFAREEDRKVFIAELRDLYDKVNSTSGPGVSSAYQGDLEVIRNSLLNYRDENLTALVLSLETNYHLKAELFKNQPLIFRETLSKSSLIINHNNNNDLHTIQLSKTENKTLKSLSKKNASKPKENSYEKLKANIIEKSKKLYQIRKNFKNDEAFFSVIKEIGVEGAINIFSNKLMLNYYTPDQLVKICNNAESVIELKLLAMNLESLSTACKNFYEQMLDKFPPEILELIMKEALGNAIHELNPTLNRENINQSQR